MGYTEYIARYVPTVKKRPRVRHVGVSVAPYVKVGIEHYKAERQREEARIIEQAKKQGVIPKEAKVTRVIRTSEGYKIEYTLPPPKQPSWKETTLAGRYLQEEKAPVEYVLEVVGLKGPAEWWGRHVTKPIAEFTEAITPWSEKEASARFGAAIIAVPEATVKTVQGLVTGQPQPTPPTFMGAMISPEERKEFIEMGPAFWVGSLYASALEAMLVSKAVEKGMKGIARVGKKTGVSTWITEHVTKPAKTGTLGRKWHEAKLAYIEHAPWEPWKGSKLDVWLAKHWKWYYAKTGGLAPGEVAFGHIPFGISKGAALGYKVPIAKMAQYAFATEQAWQLQLAPRTAGVWVKGAPAISGIQTYVFETAIVGGQLVKRFRPARAEEFIETPTYREYPKQPLKETFFTEGWKYPKAPLKTGEPLGFERYAWRMEKSGKYFFEREKWPTLEELRKRGLLPLVTQTQLTRMGIYPYISKTTVVTGKKGISKLAIGLGITTFAKTITRPQTPKRLRKRQALLIIPKVWQPTYAWEKEKFRPLTLEQPRLKERERLIPVLKVPVVQVQPQAPKQVARLKQKMSVTPKIPYPYRFKELTKRDFLMFYPPGPKPTFGETFEKLFGKWFYRKHPIASPSEVVRKFMGLDEKPKRRKKTKPKSKRRKRRRKR
jgi:hypothetical protein